MYHMFLNNLKNVQMQISNSVGCYLPSCFLLQLQFFYYFEIGDKQKTVKVSNEGNENRNKSSFM